MKRIILGSGSPRRDEILTIAGIEHEIIVPNADESVIKFDGNVEKYVTSLAELKSKALTELLKNGNKTEIKGNDSVVTICADTVVYSPKAGVPLGKPHDFDEACEMLSLLSGETHYVLTGVCISQNPTFCEKCEKFTETTEVRFKNLQKSDIEDYVRRTNPYDKAGAYGIQDSSCVFVSGIVGDYYNVMGLPISRIYDELKKLDF